MSRRTHFLRAPLSALALAASVAGLFASSPARAEGTALKAGLVEPKAVKLDGVPKEWPALIALSHNAKGKATKTDLEAKGAISYDAATIFVAVEVTDDVLKGGGDHVSLILGFPGGATHEVLLYPGEPGKSAASAKTKEGKAIAGAKVIEAPTKGGWTLEASIPWNAFPPAATVRVGLRGALFVHDADASTTIETSVGSAPKTAYESLPPVSIESEQALSDSLIKEKGIKGGPKYNLIADVAGDALKERVLVWDKYLIVLGPTFRKGSEFYWNEVGVDVAQGMLPSCETRDLTGDGQAEIILRKRLGTPKKYREYIQVLQFANSDVPNTIFQHEIAVVTEKGAIENEVRFDADGAKSAITILSGKARDFDGGNYSEPRETSMDPALLPWSTIASQTYKWNGKAFAKTGEEKQAAKEAPPPPAAAKVEMPKAKAPDPGELLVQVYDLYKQSRKATGKPKITLSADVAGDKTAETVLLHDRDLVVFGKGYKEGTGFTFMTLAQFAKASDISEVTTMDLTGDGKAEIIVKGTVHASASPELGGTVDREMLLVYQLDGDGMKRIFAAEISRAIGKKKVSADIKYVKNGKAFDIELRPGSAVEWSAANYPFTQDTAAAGGIEPLLLPWSGLPAAKYRWKTGGFSK